MRICRLIRSLSDVVPECRLQVSWTTPTLMANVCNNGCDCTYPLCPDQPDVPRNHQYCR